MTYHSALLKGAIHILNNYEYADETARLAATGFVAADIGKVARQLDNNSFWVLTTTTPTWMSITGGGVDEAPIDGNQYVRKDADWKEIAPLGYVLATWGANLQNTGRFPRINEVANGLEVGGLGIDASAPVPADGTIDTMTYYMDTGDNTTVFKIIKNGAVAYTFTCDAAYGQETGIDVPVALGDNVAIEYDAGMKPAGGLYTIYIS